MRFLRVTYLWILLAPWCISALGAASNQLVLLANHDRFPVAMNAVKFSKWIQAPVQDADGILMLDDVHCLMSSKTHLNILADIFHFHDDIQSIGDLLLDAGVKLSDFCTFVWFAIAVITLWSLGRNSVES